MAISKHPVGVDVDNIAIDDVDVVDDVVVDNEDYHIQTSRQPSLCSLEGETPFWWHSDIALQHGVGGRMMMTMVMMMMTKTIMMTKKMIRNPEKMPLEKRHRFSRLFIGPKL